MRNFARSACALILVGLSVPSSATPSIAVANDRIYRATSGTSFTYEGGQLLFFIYDGNALSNTECPSLAAGVGLLPYFPGDLPCPAGHNAFVTRRFGDRDRDVSNSWHRLGSVDEASRIPARVPEYIRLVAAPITDLPRPSNEFKDRSTLVLHDLQSATFREKDATRYEMTREYLVSDADANGDGILTDLERELHKQQAKVEEIRHLRETIINTGNTNGYLFTYPIRPWIELNKDLDVSYAPTDEIAVNQLQFIEAYPGISNRAGITSTRKGFRFTNLNNMGTDYDGDPAVLVDYRSPGSISWSGNDFSNLIQGLDQAFLKVFERRFTSEGTPIAYNGVGEIAVTVVEPGDAPGDPAVATALGHGLEDGEEITLYRTGFSALDGQRFFVNLQSDKVGFDAANQFELFIDEGLNEPLVLDIIPDGTLGVLNPMVDGAPDISDIAITPGDPVTITTLSPHGLADGDSFTIDDSGLTSFEGQAFYAGNTTDTTLEVFTDVDLTEAFVYAAFPNPAALFDAAFLGNEQNDFEWPIWPFPFVDQNFGGQLLLPSVFDNGYEFPSVAFSLFYGSEFGAQNLAALAEPPRNDLIMRIRYSRSVATADLSGSQALVPGDLSRRDFELELVLVDTISGLTSALGTLGAKSVKGAKSDEAATEFGGDLDGDGQSDLFEFAFDASAANEFQNPPIADANSQVSAQVTVEIDPETSLCELTVKKRPGVREYIQYYFEEVGLDGQAALIDFSDPENPNTEWKVVKDDNFEYKIVSTSPVSGFSLFRACARENTFGVVTP
ncbi:hypothetical protein [Roseibacillus persicicus]|uniref:hypothetical protein n=1 Tax=Roseibacillus persicicus TaxID=454148 RepID=UPI0016780E20|nr:hypothetical protein [Roseibacillus persicicus]MDQ8191827.1 hypothetical protein [Roseibacillus persicicus]